MTIAAENCKMPRGNKKNTLIFQTQPHPSFIMDQGFIFLLCIMKDTPHYVHHPCICTHSSVNAVVQSEIAGMPNQWTNYPGIHLFRIQVWWIEVNNKFNNYTCFRVNFFGMVIFENFVDLLWFHNATGLGILFL